MENNGVFFCFFFSIFGVCCFFFFVKLYIALAWVTEWVNISVALGIVCSIKCIITVNLSLRPCFINEWMFYCVTGWLFGWLTCLAVLFECVFFYICFIHFYKSDNIVSCCCYCCCFWFFLLLYYYISYCFVVVFVFIALFKNTFFVFYW